MAAQHLGIDLADGPDDGAVDHDRGGAGRVQPVDLGVADLGLRQVEEVDDRAPRPHGGGGIAPGQDDAEVLALVRQLGTGIGRTAEHVADLEEPDTVVAVRGVVGDGGDQSREKGGTQDRLLRHQRVRDLDAVVLQPAPRDLTRGQEGHWCDLGQAETGERVPHAAPLVLAGRERATPRRAGHGLAELDVAVGAGDFLDDIDLDRAVVPERRDRDP